jgi:hypothetical protein
MCFIATALGRRCKACLKMVQRNRVRLIGNGTHQFLAYSDDVNLLGESIDPSRKIEEL